MNPRSVMRWLDFKITNRCNNNCVYCGVRQDPPSAPETLPTQAVMSTLDEAIEAGFQFICLLGGEPTLRADLPEILAHLGRHEHLNILLVTNLKQYRMEVVEALFSSACQDARVVGSLDSLRPPTYKRTDPAVGFERLRMMSQIAARYASPQRRRSVDVHSVISRENFFRVEDLVRTLDALGVELSMAMVCPTVVTETPEAFNEFRPADIDTVVQQLQRLDTEGKLAYSNQVLLEYLRERGRRVPRQRDECTAGRHQVIINADGEVYPCITESYRRGLRFGNVKEEGFSSIIPRVEAFTCQREEESACWDHYLWTRIVQRHAAERDGAHVVP